MIDLIENPLQSWYNNLYIDVSQINLNPPPTFDKSIFVDNSLQSGYYTSVDPTDLNKYNSQPLNKNGKYKFYYQETQIQDPNNPTGIPIPVLGWLPAYLEDQTSLDYDINVNIPNTTPASFNITSVKLGNSIIADNNINTNWAFQSNRSQFYGNEVDDIIIISKNYSTNEFIVMYGVNLSSDLADWGTLAHTIPANSWVYHYNFTQNNQTLTFNTSQSYFSISMNDSPYDTGMQSTRLPFSQFDFMFTWMTFDPAPTTIPIENENVGENNNENNGENNNENNENNNGNNGNNGGNNGGNNPGFVLDV